MPDRSSSGFAYEVLTTDPQTGKAVDALLITRPVKGIRMLYVLANTVRHKDRGGRISRVNKEWAKTIPVCENPDGSGGVHCMAQISAMCPLFCLDLPVYMKYN